MNEAKSASWWRGPLWMATGGLLVYLLAVDPLGVHPVDDWLGANRVASSAEPTGGTDEPLFYRNPMDPTITSPVQMQDEMGMDYIPVYADQDAAPGAPRSSGDAPVVSIDPAVVQNMNVRTAPAELRALQPEVRTVGSLELDAERVVTVTTRFSGFVEKVHVNYVGEVVRRGQALFEVYSPELVQTQQELLSALDYSARFEGKDPEAHHHALGLVEAARLRMGYWDISHEQIERLEESGEIQRTLKVTAPASGVVMERMEGLEGMAVRPGMEAYRIADLSVLWAGVELFESQIAWARIGTPVKLIFTAFPEDEFSGVVRFVEPKLSEQSRTLKVKVEVKNPGGRLRPGMFATVRFQPPASVPVVAVPRPAVIRTGSRSLVIVALGDGRFQPREVHLGREAAGWSEVHGVEPGERVVTSSQFLIDSEANIQAVVQGMLGASPADAAENSTMKMPEMDMERVHGEGLGTVESGSMKDMSAPQSGDDDHTGLH